ncbi:MAG TPA: hypothetical protein VL095_09745 [Flavisolibacter sp.]|nr:hypothetical protein [Flavisolibacter sp.]
MSFEANDMNTVHLGNYEEFFILYMDNELSEEQVKMVDEFLAVHPDLKAEFEVLMSTKLPLEEFNFDKTALMAENMKLSSVDEELLLYIDNELPADEKKKLELELASNNDYQLQHRVLLQTKLDPSEKIVYPNKKELYRREERVVSIKIWMRVAAAVIVIAVGGILYLQDSISSTTPPPITAGPTKIHQKNDPKKNELPELVTPSSENYKKDEIAVNNAPKKEVKQDKSTDRKDIKVEIPVQQQNEIAYTPQEIKEDVVDKPVVRNIEADRDNNIEKTTASSVNKEFVTSSLANRLDNSSGDDEKSYASNDDRKGSIRGFLRKATRMIEKRTGIDPTNDGELLIGAVAINLK